MDGHRAGGRWGLVLALTLAVGLVAFHAPASATTAPRPYTPKFQMPFYYHQTWLASTYNGHYPNQNSIDLRRYYNGQNISSAAPVVASEGGTIAEVGPVLSPEGDYYGDYVYINHPGGWQTRYLHIKKLAAWTKGKAIVRGQLIGAIGQYLAMQPHLHYTQLKNGSAVRVKFNGSAINVWKGAERPDHTYPTQNLTSRNAPTGCALTGAKVKCSYGAAVRVVVECWNLHTGNDYFRRGSWAAAKDASTAKCQPGHPQGSVSYEVT